MVRGRSRRRFGTVATQAGSGGPASRQERHGTLPIAARMEEGVRFGSDVLSAENPSILEARRGPRDAGGVLRGSASDHRTGALLPSGLTHAHIQMR